MLLLLIHQTLIYFQSLYGILYVNVMNVHSLQLMQTHVIVHLELIQIIMYQNLLLIVPLTVQIHHVVDLHHERVESLAQLAFAYPARRILARPTSNLVLNVIIAASVALQLLTITFAPLRAMLGLVPLDAPVLGYVAAALLVTVLGAEVWTRRVALARNTNA